MWSMGLSSGWSVRRCSAGSRSIGLKTCGNLDAKLGQSGKDKSCTVVTQGTRVISCTNSGNPCTGSSVTP